MLGKAGTEGGLISERLRQGCRRRAGWTMIGAPITSKCGGKRTGPTGTLMDESRREKQSGSQPKPDTRGLQRRKTDINRITRTKEKKKTKKSLAQTISSICFVHLCLTRRAETFSFCRHGDGRPTTNKEQKGQGRATTTAENEKTAAKATTTKAHDAAMAMMAAIEVV
ncbi:hypothetical protein N657DRAFT_386681 [Parathielavia appendiculata]|uniref:Uncharacterized protein n=1 Tax=Parathielavia appendiculata TaxID=2587402 RepID=A0AAN6Z3V1_9PEZI|nr:hypothetical protein N657DRAFT_386681 [Parathielavia appendiculata]